MSQPLPPEPPLNLADLRHRYDRARFIPLLLTASVLAHEVLFLGWIFYRKGITLSPPNPAPIPLEFIALDDPAVAVPNPETNRIAQVASQGGAQTSTDRPSIARNANAAASQTPDETPDPTPAQQQPSPTNQPLASSQAQDAGSGIEALSLSPQGWERLARNTVPASQTNPEVAIPRRTTSEVLGTGSLSAQNWHPYAQRLNHDRADRGSGVTARADVEWGPYTAQLQQQVESQWQPDADFESKVEVYFEVNRWGTVEKLDVLQPSGDVTIDLAAKSAILQAAPFPPFPAN
ncbi:MAG: TonB C-terminal domain-containing protein, partial [Prochlorothrix sp.]